MIHKESYSRHNDWYGKHFPSEKSKTDFYKRAKNTGQHNVAHWLQQLFFNCIDPLLQRKDDEWLTIGDAYGFDARYILNSGNKALATDLNIDFLSIALQEEVITSCAAENAEELSFKNESFDYVLCKESYHHFPRPYAAMYEMLRVAKAGVIIMEPQDPISKMPSLLMLSNFLSSYGSILNKVWRNRFSFEPVGNFVYKVSEREFEKMAAGLGLPMIGFKKINPNFWFKDADLITTKKITRKFLSIRFKKNFLDLMVKLKILPAQVLSTIIFKQVPDSVTLGLLKNSGYQLISIPTNPFYSV